MLSSPRRRLLPGDRSAQRQALVCFSHLRWSFVWQRPQHLLTRFGKEMDVYMVEEPEFAPDQPLDTLRISTEGDVTVLTPLLAREPGDDWGFNDRTNPAIARLLGRALASEGIASSDTDLIAWYYTPMAIGALPANLRPSLTVFDAMDELAAFAGAPAGIREREAEIMRRADVVFTGGPSLYRARRHRHPRVHCFPSGVDAAHFASARDITRLPHDLADLDSPILGFHGVIDERMDRDLLAGIADARPAWTLVLVGPVVKIAPEDLPRRPNIVYAGKRTYAELPAYLASFDAAILPFALNDATRFISPTKTLEYLAAGKPVVSTQIRDVIDLYGEVVEIATDADSFVSAIERLWHATPGEYDRRSAAANRLLTKHDWDNIAADMRSLMERRLAERRETSRAAAPLIGQFSESAVLGSAASD